MLQRIFVHLIFACLMSSTLLAQGKSGFEITGRLPGLKEGEKVLMTMFHGNGFTEFVDWTRTDSAIVKNGEFHLKGYIPEGPRWFYIYFDKHPKPTLRIALDNNEVVTISSAYENVLEEGHGFIDDYVKIEGSPTAHSIYQFRNAYIFYQQIMGRLNKHLNVIKDSVGFDKSLVTGIMLAKEAANKTLYNSFLSITDSSLIKRPASILFFQPHLINLSGHASFLAEFYNNRLDRDEKNSYYGKKWYDEGVKLGVGQLFPVFNFPDANSKPLALKDIYAKK